jgi:hypothetical protein
MKCEMRVLIDQESCKAFVSMDGIILSGHDEVNQFIEIIEGAVKLIRLSAQNWPPEARLTWDRIAASQVGAEV